MIRRLFWSREHNAVAVRYDKDINGESYYWVALKNRTPLAILDEIAVLAFERADRKSTRLNSSH